jgi:hypothetical protein
VRRDGSGDDLPLFEFDAYRGQAIHEKGGVHFRETAKTCRATPLDCLPRLKKLFRPEMRLMANGGIRSERPSQFQCSSEFRNTDQYCFLMMRTPDGHSRLELSRFLKPPVVADHRNAPVNALGYLRVMFAVDNIDETLEKLRKRGAQLVGEVVQYQDSYRLCYIRGPEGLRFGLAQQLN